MTIVSSLPFASTATALAATAAPAPALRAGYSQLAFSDDFDSLDTIDTTLSGAAGFNWYLDRLHGWPAMTASELAVKDSVLTINQKTSNCNVGISTMCSSTKNGASFGPSYFEARIRFDPTLQPRRDGSPSFFSVSADAFNGLPRSRWGELDFYETIPGAYNGSVHDWSVTNGVKQDLLNTRSNYALTPGTDYSQWNTVGCLWAEGCIQYFLNDALILTTHYSRNTPPPENPNLPTGTFSILDDETNGMVVILGSGSDYPMEVDWIRVWTAPSMTSDIARKVYSPTPALPYNAQFTYADTSGFTAQNGAAVALDTTQPQSGTTCLRIEHSASSTSSVSVFIVRNLRAAERIFAALWYRGSDSQTFRATLHFVDDDNNYLGNFSGPTVETSSDWREYRFAGVAPVGSTKLFLAIDRPSMSTSSVAWIDMVNVWQ